mgnify:CR=1 FL=1|jgi:hypothetical protein|tara:strand:- start:223 stop:1878 length:1656 start_codon:yes stop_codon:yes gene_type:complete
MKFLKIALLVDNLDLDNFNSEIVEVIKKNDFLKIETVIINNINKKNKFLFYLKKYSIFRLIEKTLFKIIYLFEKNILYKFFENYNFSKVNIDEITNNKLFVSPIIAKNGYFYNYSENDLKEIREKQLDVIIGMGSGILKGDILNITKYGILSFHHGDHDINRGGPPGFWEVYFKIPRTGFIIQKLNNNLDGGDVLFKGYFQTKHFYYQNKQSIYKNSAQYIEYTLLKILNNESKIIENKLYFNKIFKDPNLIQLLKYIITTYSKILFKFLEKILLLKRVIWNVAYKKGKLYEHRLEQFDIIENNNKNRFIADPFLFKKNGNNYLFVEDFSFVKNIGVISCYELNNKNCNFLGQVIKEKFHLSFPFIFEFENQIYMCPETHEQKEIRLYHCLDFPKKWEYKMTLIKNILAVDTLIFAKNDIWWMLTNTSKTDTKDFCELSIFYSKKGPLTDKWIAHKSNPIYVDPCLARNGGILFKKNKIYRVNQKNGFNFYGKEFDINEILTINVDTYNEKLISNVKPNFLKNIIGTHHLNNNEDFITIDFCKKKYFFSKK